MQTLMGKLKGKLDNDYEYFASKKRDTLKLKESDEFIELRKQSVLKAGWEHAETQLTATCNNMSLYSLYWVDF